MPSRALVLARLAAEGGDFAYGLRYITDTLRSSHLRDHYELLHAERGLAMLMVRFRLAPRNLPRLSGSPDANDRALATYAEFVCRPNPIGVPLPSPPDPKALFHRPGAQWKKPPEILLPPSFQPSTPPQPPRRELALGQLELGDICGFSDGPSAMPLLEQAAKDLKDAHDYVAAFIAHARRAVVIASHPDLSGVYGSQLSAALTACHDALNTLRPTLREENRPPRVTWMELQLLDVDVGAISQDWLASLGNWAPWLSRLALCQLRQRAIAQRGWDFNEVECQYLREQLLEQADIASLMGRSFGKEARTEAAPSPDEVETPTDQETATLAPPSPSAARKPRAPIAFVWKALLAAAGGWLVVLPFVDLDKLVATLNRVFKFHVPGTQGSVLPWPFFSVWTLLVGLTALVAYGTSQLLDYERRRRTLIEVQAEDNETSSSPLIDCHFTIRAPLFPPFGRLSRKGSEQAFRLQPPSQAPYRALEPQLAPGLQHAFIASRELVAGSSLRVHLTLRGAYAQRLPWEALLAMYAGLEPEQLRVLRRTGSFAYWWSKGRPPDPSRRPPEINIVTNAEVAFSVAASAWRRSTVDPVATDYITRSDSRQRSGAHVIHLIGDVYGSGPELRIRVGTRSSDADDFEDALDLVTRHPAAEIAIVQGALSLSKAGGRQDSDRRDAATLREFATQLYEGGIPIVIVIPSLRADVAARVLRPITRAALRPRSGIRRILAGLPMSGSKPLDPHLWLDAIAAARRALREADLPPYERFELACDIVLFAADQDPALVTAS